MNDSRSLVLFGLLALVAAVWICMPTFHFGNVLDPVMKVLPWIAIAFIASRFGGCCGRRCHTSQEADA